MSHAAAIYAPPGWGYRPGHRIDMPTAAELPALEGLENLSARARNRKIVDAIRSIPGLAHNIHAGDIRLKYGLKTSWEAWDLLQRARA